MFFTPPHPPVTKFTNCHTFSETLPLERDVLYERPLCHLGEGGMQRQMNP